MRPTHKPDTSPDERVKVAAGGVDIGFGPASAPHSGQTAEQNPLSDHDLRVRRGDQMFHMVISHCTHQSPTNFWRGSLLP